MSLKKRPTYGFLIFTFILAFIIFPFLKLSYEAYSTVNTIRETSKSINAYEKNSGAISESFSRLSSHTKALNREIRYPLWNILAHLTNKKQDFLDLKYAVNEFSILAPLSQEFLGFNSPRRYLVIFQNPAEARGTGGIAGAYAIIVVERGKFTVSSVGSDLDFKSMSKMPISISSEFTQNYGDDPAIWQNSNLSPHFPYAARIWGALWANQGGEKIDGVLAVDPFVLKAILKGTGPIQLPDGIEINAENVVAETLSTAYTRFEGKNLERKDFLIQIAQGVLSKLETGEFSKALVARSLLKPYREHRILLYSNRLKQERGLQLSTLGGSLDQYSNDVRVIIQNIAGNKLDYYIDRQVKISSLQCGEGSKTRVSLTVTNTATRILNLPSYVMGRLDIGLPNGKSNSHKVSVFIFGPKGRELLWGKHVGSAGLDAFSGYERGRAYYSVPVELPAGGRATVLADFEGSPKGLKVTVQPLVISQKTLIHNRC